MDSLKYPDNGPEWATTTLTVWKQMLQTQAPMKVHFHEHGGRAGPEIVYLRFRGKFVGRSILRAA